MSKPRRLLWSAVRRGCVIWEEAHFVAVAQIEIRSTMFRVTLRRRRS